MMRLFIAVNFDEKVKNRIFKVAQELKACCQSGNFTLKDHFHLTLVFIGETDKIDSVKKAMDTLSFSPFALKLRDLCRFKRQGGDIYWVGVEPNGSLDQLYHSLFNALSKGGFKLETREYKPHLTIGREVVLKNMRETGLPDVTDINLTVSKIGLMKSERIGGRLTYTKLYEKDASSISIG